MHLSDAQSVPAVQEVLELERDPSSTLPWLFSQFWRYLRSLGA